MKRWSPRQKSLATIGDESFRRSLPPYEQEAADMDYGDSLPEAENIYLRNFTNEYYGSRFAPGERHLHDDAGKRECQRRQRSHAGDKRPDIMSYSPISHRTDATAVPEEASGGGEDEAIEAIDLKAARAWAKANPLLISHARFVNGQLQKARRQLRYLRLYKALGFREDVMSRNADGSGEQWHGDDADEPKLPLGDSSLHQQLLDCSEPGTMVASLRNRD